VALFLKGLARRISIHFNSVPVRQRACQGVEPGRVSGKKKVEYSLPGTAHSTARVARVFFMLCLCVISVCAHTVDRRVSYVSRFVIRIRLRTIPSTHRISHPRAAHMHPMLAGSLFPAGPRWRVAASYPSAPHQPRIGDLRNANGAPMRRALKSCEVSIIV